MIICGTVLAGTGFISRTALLVTRALAFLHNGSKEEQRINFLHQLLRKMLANCLS